MKVSPQDAVEHFSAELARRVAQAIEERIRAAVVKIEGGLPSREELVRHGGRTITENGDIHYTWKGAVIVIVHPGLAQNGKFSIRVSGVPVEKGPAA